MMSVRRPVNMDEVEIQDLDSVIDRSRALRALARRGREEAALIREHSRALRDAQDIRIDTLKVRMAD
jgi:hypothetical protein